VLTFCIIGSIALVFVLLVCCYHATTFGGDEDDDDDDNSQIEMIKKSKVRQPVQKRPSFEIDD